VYRVLAVVVTLLTASSTVASEKADVVASVNQFIDGFNKDDVKSALAACASPAFIIDEFPPYTWQGPSACSDWANDFEANAKKENITKPVVTLSKPRHVDIVPATYTFKQNGKPMAEPGSAFTVALQRTPSGWRITAWTWSKH